MVIKFKFQNANVVCSHEDIVAASSSVEDLAGSEQKSIFSTPKMYRRFPNIEWTNAWKWKLKNIWLILAYTKCMHIAPISRLYLFSIIKCPIIYYYQNNLQTRYWTSCLSVGSYKHNDNLAISHALSFFLGFASRFNPKRLNFRTVL